MNESKISVRYARALFQSALGKEALDRVYQDMILIYELTAMPEVREVLQSPVIRPSKKMAVLGSLLSKKVEKITLSLVELLVKNGRESFLPAVARVFMDNTLRYRGITRASLTTAVPVNDKVRHQVTSIVSEVFKTRVELKENIDKDIIGGFILKVNDSYIDASIRNKLRRVRKGLAASGRTHL